MIVQNGDSEPQNRFLSEGAGGSYGVKTYLETISVHPTGIAPFVLAMGGLWVSETDEGTFPPATAPALAAWLKRLEASP